MREDIMQKIIKKEELINNKLKNNNVLVEIMKNTENKGYIVVINKNKIVEKALEFEIVSMCQIKITENKKILERGLCIDKLDAWIYNLYNPVKYLYAFYGGRLNGKVLHRQELDDQTIVKGYLGPMYDGFSYGVVYFRYETQDVYNMLPT